MINKLLIILTFFIFLISCSHDYGESVFDEELSEETPNSIVINFREVVIKEGKPSYILEADRAETFNKRKSTVFTDLYFIEYNRAGKVATEGACVEAEYFNDSDNIEFRDKVVLNAAEQGFFIEGSYLFWDNNMKSLAGGENTSVRIGNDDGSVIEGTGFITSAPERSFSFQGRTKGKYVSSD